MADYSLLLGPNSYQGEAYSHLLGLCFAVQRYSSLKIRELAQQHFLRIKSQSMVKVAIILLFQFMPLLAWQASPHPYFQLFRSKNKTRNVHHPQRRKRQGCCKCTRLCPVRYLSLSRNKDRDCPFLRGSQKRIIRNLHTDYVLDSLWCNYLLRIK